MMMKLQELNLFFILNYKMLLFTIRTIKNNKVSLKNRYVHGEEGH